MSNVCNGCAYWCKELDSCISGMDGVSVRDKRNCEEEYVPSASHGDYSPSNPWDAPGMSVSDFI